MFQQISTWQLVLACGLQGLLHGSRQSVLFLLGKVLRYVLPHFTSTFHQSHSYVNMNGVKNQLALSDTSPLQNISARTSKMLDLS